MDFEIFVFGYNLLGIWFITIDISVILYLDVSI